MGRMGHGAGSQHVSEKGDVGEHAQGEFGRGTRGAITRHASASEGGDALFFLPFTDYELRITDSASCVRRGVS